MTRIPHGPAEREPETVSPEAFRARLGEGRIAQIFDYWDGKRAGGGLPARDAIDPAEIPRLLPWVYLLEPLGDGGARVRLAGTRIRELFDCELTGQDLVAQLPRPFADNARRSYRLVVERHCGWLTLVDSRLRDGKILPYRRLALPLSRDGREVDRILGAVDWDEWQIGSRPFWEVWDEAVGRERQEAVCRFG